MMAPTLVTLRVVSSFIKWPNAPAFSRRERAEHDHVINSNNLAREAVSWNAWFGAFGTVPYGLCLMSSRMSINGKR